MTSFKAFVYSADPPLREQGGYSRIGVLGPYYFIRTITKIYNFNIINLINIITYLDFKGLET